MSISIDDAIWWMRSRKHSADWADYAQIADWLEELRNIKARTTPTQYRELSEPETDEEREARKRKALQEGLRHAND